MVETRDYVEWHRGYDDPNSGLSWRLEYVRRQIRQRLDERSGQQRIVSACAGDGRDVIGVLATRADADRIDAYLIEINETLAERARSAAATAGLSRVHVRVADAGWTDAFVDAVPADLVLLMGIFGNITDEDVHETIRATPQLCAPEATVLWSRARSPRDINELIRTWFIEEGFTDLDYATHDGAGLTAAGVMRYTGPQKPHEPGRRMFTFRR
jgi:hypothetical protein